MGCPTPDPSVRRRATIDPARTPVRAGRHRAVVDRQRVDGSEPMAYSVVGGPALGFDLARLEGGAGGRGAAGGACRRTRGSRPAGRLPPGRGRPRGVAPGPRADDRHRVGGHDAPARRGRAGGGRGGGDGAAAASREQPARRRARPGPDDPPRRPGLDLAARRRGRRPGPRGVARRRRARRRGHQRLPARPAGTRPAARDGRSFVRAGLALPEVETGLPEAGSAAGRVRRLRRRRPPGLAPGRRRDARTPPSGRRRCTRRPGRCR